MIPLPTHFTEQTTKLTPDKLDEGSVESLNILEEKSYEVHYGLTIKYADDIAKMCLEPGIKEYCPKDWTGRFADRESTKKWLAKGRGTFLLLKREGEDLKLAGYGWVGKGNNENIDGGETTFAIRIGDSAQGQGLATHFARLIVYGSKNIYDAKNIWLETWQSNSGAVHVYHKIGFTDVNKIELDRPRPDGSSVSDTRIYMKLF